MTNLTPIAGRTIEARDQKKEVIDLLRKKADEIERGEAYFNNVLIALLDDSEVDEFDQCTVYIGRASTNLGSLDIARVAILQNMGVLPSGPGEE